MKKLILPVLASLAFATPALADSGEGRVEVRGGAVWANAQTQDAWGAAAGYDFDLGPAAFAGVEVSGDKNGIGGSKMVFGFTGRAGIKTGTGTRIFGAAGYSTEVCDVCDAQWHAGAGLEQNVAGPAYVKVEYRRYFANDSIGGADAAVVGAGFRF